MTAYLSLPPRPGSTDISWSLGEDIVSSSTLFEWSGEEGEGTRSATHTIDKTPGCGLRLNLRNTHVWFLCMFNSLTFLILKRIF